MGGVAVTSAKRQHWFGKVTGKKIEGKNIVVGLSKKTNHVMPIYGRLKYQHR